MFKLNVNAAEAIVAREPARAANQSPRALRQRLRRRARGNETHALNRLFGDNGFRQFRVY